ncbi:hypothetical protein PFISCL1PPCAC_7787, partial [Pristionchus fissidentatus]
NGCRETRSVESWPDLIRCTCQGTYCRKCYPYRCITVTNCDSKRKRTAVEQLKFHKCFCSETNPSNCQRCDMFGCRQGE